MQNGKGRLTNAQREAREHENLEESRAKVAAADGEFLEQIAIEDAIAELMAELGDDQDSAQIRVFRKTDLGKREFCEAYPLSEFGGDVVMLRRIREDWGPGKYTLSLKHKARWIFNREVQIAREPSESNRAKLDQLTELGRQIDGVRNESQRMIADAISGLKDALARAAPPPAPAVDPMAQMRTTVELLTMARSMFQPQKSATEQIAELTGILNVTKEVRAMASEDAGGGDILTTLAPKAFDAITAALANSQRQAPIPRQNARPQALAAPAPAANMPQADPAPQPIQGNNVTPQIAQMTPEERELVAAIGQLNLAAAFGQNPENYAEAVYERAPEELFGMLQSADWWDQLVAMAPAVAEHRDFYTRLKDAVLRIKLESESQGPEDDDADDGANTVNGAALAPATPPAKAA